MEDVFVQTEKLRRIVENREIPSELRTGAEMRLRQDEHVRAWRLQTRRELISLCSDPRAAQIVFNGLSDWLSGMAAGRAMAQLRAELTSKGMLAHKDAKKVNCRLPALPVVQEYQRELAVRKQAMLDEIRAVFAACDDATEARAIYNQDSNPMSASKISSWQQALVRAGILKASWRYRPSKKKMEKRTWRDKMMSRLENK